MSEVEAKTESVGANPGPAGLEEKSKVFILLSNYKECDTEILGVYDSKESLLSAFAGIILFEYNSQMHKNANAPEFAGLLCRLSGALLGECEYTDDFGCPVDGCCFGGATYRIEERQVMGRIRNED